VIEILEDRRFLSATLANGVLTVNGTNRNDFIHIAPKNGNLLAQVNKTHQTFKESDVKSLKVNGLSGNDNISFGSTQIGATVDGDDGNDVILGTANADTISGGKGHDYIFAGGGNDSVTGGDGNDVIIGGKGNDTLHGDAGNDVISGADGDDQLFGDAGNDLLFGAAGSDKVDGGAGTDRALKQGNDTFTHVEKVWK
jgi:Ca2+-binding RTX toxin-like protein